MPMYDLRVIVFHNHRSLFFTAITAVLSFFALSPTPSAAPIVLTLTTLLLYCQTVFTSRYALRDTVWLGATIAFAGTLARASPSLSALSSSGGAVAILFVLNLIDSVLAISFIYLQNRLRTRLQSPVSQLTLFPALWATLWFGVSFLSPVGRLSAWSSAEGAGFYGWMMPYFGPLGNDWIVAAWAVVLLRAVESWYIGEEIPTAAQTAPATEQNSLLTQKSSLLFFTALLVALAVPSLILHNFPLTVVAGPQITPLSVGCVLPQYRRYRHHTLTLEDYIDESKMFTASARLLLWPEGAVTFTSENDMAEGLEKVRQAIPGSVVVGVSFEESFGNPDSGKSGSRRTGIALVSQRSTSPELIYYKRHLVPVAESFSLTHFNNPPNIASIPLKAPKYINNTEWVPDGPPYTRPIPVTASICLDFAHPGQFSTLESRPALILAPARTWDIAVGNAMWQQARQRAEELGTMVLWCDGGDGGVSGIAGGGFNDFLQVGLGSWVKTIGVPYPFDERRTIHARAGDLGVAFIWVLVLGGPALGLFAPSIRNLSNLLRRKRNAPSVLEGNLLDF